MRSLCVIEMQWVAPILKKLEKINITKLRYSRFFQKYTSLVYIAFSLPYLIVTTFLRENSGGSSHSEEKIEGDNPNLQKQEVVAVGPPDDRDSKIQAARDRFLARKANK